LAVWDLFRRRSPNGLNHHFSDMGVWCTIAFLEASQPDLAIDSAASLRIALKAAKPLELPLHQSCGISFSHPETKSTTYL